MEAVSAAGWMIEGWVLLDEPLYSNLTCELDEQVARQLRERPNLYAHHTAWEFIGCIWYRDGRWHEQVFRHHLPVAAYADVDVGDLIAHVKLAHGYG